MASRPFDPRRLDIERFAREGASLEGTADASSFARLDETRHADSRGTPAQVAWTAVGEWRKPRGGQPEPWLHLRATATLSLECQRCLGPVDSDVEVDRWFRFAGDEASASDLDAQVEEDVLALSRAFDLTSLLEDELLLALPLVPRHDDCRPAVPPGIGELPDPADGAPTAHPFSVLEALRGRGKGGA
jgi:uncharacterized protein